MNASKERRARCVVCGHSHRALGIEIRDRVLLRTARASAHLVRQFGGAWAFAARVWDAHSAEIHRVQVLDTESGTLYHADIDTVIRYAFRRVLDVRAGDRMTAQRSPMKPAHRKRRRRSQCRDVLTFQTRARCLGTATGYVK